MRKQYILLSTVCCGVLLSVDVAAQCIATKDCGSLGYKQSSCDSGKGIKCPFGEAWYCPCDASYIYTCTGTNESPSSAKCGDKYSMCNCATGTHWDSSSGKCVADRASCSIGWIYYSDGTCSAPAAYTTSKTALGVVVYVNPDGVGGQVMTAWPIDKNGNKSSSYVSIYWSTEYVDITSLPNYTSYQTAMKDYDSCGNTDKIIAQGSSSTYPAAWAARSYAPTPETKGKWCLPAAGVISSWYNNRSAIDTAISKLGGKTLGSNDDHHWSSSEDSNYDAWGLCTGDGASQGGLGWCGKGNYRYVRPVLAF